MCVESHSAWVHSLSGNATVVIPVPGHEYVALHPPRLSWERKKQTNTSHSNTKFDDNLNILPY